MQISAYLRKSIIYYRIRIWIRIFLVWIWIWTWIRSGFQIRSRSLKISVWSDLYGTLVYSLWQEEDITKETIRKNLRTLKSQLNGASLILLLNWNNYWQRSNHQTFYESCHWCLMFSTVNFKVIKSLSPAEKMEVSTPFVDKMCRVCRKNSVMKISLIFQLRNSYTTSAWRRVKMLCKELWRILEIWENLVLSKKYIRSQNKRTYITDIIVPVIQAALKNLLVRKSVFVSMWLHYKYIKYNIFLLTFHYYC